MSQKIRRLRLRIGGKAQPQDLCLCISHAHSVEPMGHLAMPSALRLTLWQEQEQSFRLIMYVKSKSIGRT